MTQTEWQAIQRYLPEREPDDTASGPELFYELLNRVDDLSYHALQADRNGGSVEQYRDLTAACDLTIATAIDLMENEERSIEVVREMIEDEADRSVRLYGPPEERKESYFSLVIILVEEVGEVATELQNDVFWSDPVAVEAAQVASVALTIRRVASHRMQ